MVLCSINLWWYLVMPQAPELHLCLLKSNLRYEKSGLKLWERQRGLILSVWSSTTADGLR